MAPCVYTNIAIKIHHKSATNYYIYVYVYTEYIILTQGFPVVDLIKGYFGFSL